MKIITSKKSFTLVELLVACLIVIIVIIGVYSIGNVLSSNNQDLGQRFLVKSTTQATLNHILNNATLAIGSQTNDSYGNADTGVLVGATVGDPNSFCIHQAGGSGNNIINNASDIWLCYTWIPPTAASNQYNIYWCTSLFVPSSSYRGAAAPCISTSTNYTYLGTAYTMTTKPYNALNGFSITLQNCLNNSATGSEACSNTGISDDPANNPEVQLSGTVYPPQDGSV